MVYNFEFFGIIKMKRGGIMDILKMSTRDKDQNIAIEIVSSLKKLGGSATKREIVEYFRLNSEIISEELIDLRRISKKAEMNTHLLSST